MNTRYYMVIIKGEIKTSEIMSPTIQARSTEDVPDKGTYAKFLLVGCYMKPDEEGVRMYRFDGQTPLTGMVTSRLSV